MGSVTDPAVGSGAHISSCLSKVKCSRGPILISGTGLYFLLFYF